MSEDLTSEGAPDAITVVRLVKEFQRRDAVVREAAIRRLLPYPEAAANYIVASYPKASLAVRLAGLELLTAWKAPVDGLDPWLPESLTDERRQALTAWAAAVAPPSPDADPDRPLTPEELSDLGRTLQQMLDAQPAEAAAIRERLARLGRRLLPLVYAELAKQDTDAPRERLTALRYRLVAAPDLVLRWPGGIERLAATDLQTRVNAADEFARQAVAADEPLLLELFSDPAPLVREISLRALQNVGGASAGSALVRLLEDPDPNVRAAVLKQLATKPAPEIVPAITKYVAGESDPDLVVHAARLLREASGKAALDALVTLFDHASWRVRAEAAEGVGKAAGNRSSLEDEEKAAAYVELIHLLDDDDGFVISRAVEALTGADLVTAVEPLVETAQKHPELAPSVVAALAQGDKQRTKALPHLRTFCVHEAPTVRAAAIAALCQVVPDGAQDELKAAIADPEAKVRIAAADAFFGLVTQMVDNQLSNAVLQPEASPISTEAVPTDEPPVAGEAPADPAPARPDEEPAPDAPAEPGEPPSAQVLQRLHSGELAPQWMRDFAELLLPLLGADNEDERLAAARPLAALGRAEALPNLHAAAQRAALGKGVAAALPYLLWTDRAELFREITAAAGSVDRLVAAAGFVVETADHRSPGLLWELLAGDNAGARLTDELLYPFRRAYFADNYYSISEAPASDRKRLLADAAANASAGARWQRTAALALLLAVESEPAAQAAQQVLDDAAADPGLRSDAFAVLLRAQSETDATRTAVAGLASSDAAARRLSLTFLTLGSSSLATLPSGVNVDRYSYSSYPSYGGGETPALPAAPEGLAADVLLPLLIAGDAETAARAGYLLALIGREEGLSALLDYWSRQKRGDPETTGLVYRAIAAIDSADHVSTLESIYDRMRKDQDQGNWNVREFYWMIRGMTDRRALDLRKRIRDDVGMDNLR